VVMASYIHTSAFYKEWERHVSAWAYILGIPRVSKPCCLNLFFLKNVIKFFLQIRLPFQGHAADDDVVVSYHFENHVDFVFQLDLS
jgi:hypothetical protein